MPSPQVTSVDWGDVVTTCLENRSKRLADNVTNNNALLTYMDERGRKEFSGGREIVQELKYAQNNSFTFYSGYDPVNISVNDTMTAARFAIKQAAIAVVVSGLEELQNDGDERMMDLVESRIETAEDTFENQMSAGIYSDGTGWGGKQITGLATLIGKTPTSGVVGGIDRGTYAWWRNLAANANTDPRGVVTASNIVSYMNSMAINLKRNTEGVNLIVFDGNYYGYYLSTLQNIQRITEVSGNKRAGSGFMALKYYGAGKEVDVILDGGKGGQIPANTGYFLNSKYLFYRPHAKRNFRIIGKERANANQDATVRLFGWAGNLTISNSSLQGVLWQ